MADQRQRTAALVGILLTALSGVMGAPSGAEEDNPLPCLCTDVDPRTSFITPVEYTCWEQYKFGQCQQDFMKQTILEIPEGYCQISCGHCDCCPSLRNASLSAGLNEFVWAMQVLTNATKAEDLDQPGLMMTLLAPDDNAMRNLFDKLGGKEKIQSDADGARDKLEVIMNLHLLPPLPDSKAVWTSPFMLKGTKLDTLGNIRNALEVVNVDAGSGEIDIQGPGSSARVKQRDIYACKGFVNVVNWYFLPSGSQA